MRLRPGSRSFIAAAVGKMIFERIYELASRHSRRELFPDRRNNEPVLRRLRDGAVVAVLEEGRWRPVFDENGKPLNRSVLKMRGIDGYR
jgi:hypothetical protein